MKLDLPSDKNNFYFDQVSYLNSAGEVVENQCLVTKDGLISDIGHSKKIKGKYPDQTFHSLQNYFLVPGMVNSHSHAPLGFFRGKGHGKATLIENYLFPAEKSLTAELTESLSWSYLINGLKSGVTTFIEHYYFAEGIGRAIERLGMRGVIGETVADLGGAFPDAQAIKRQDLLLKNWNFSDRLKPSIAPHAADTVSPQLFKKLIEISKCENLLLHFHLSQTQGELDRVLARENKTPVEYAHSLGAVYENSLIVHLVTANDSDIKLISESGATIGFCPASQIIYEKLAPFEKFLESGIPLALGTDCAASNDGSDILSELKLTGLLHMHQSKPKSTIEIPKLINMVTANPFKISGFSHKLGKIAEGYKADLVFFSRDIDLAPFNTLNYNFIYSASPRNVQHVMIDGKWILQNQKLVLVDEEELKSEYLKATQELSKRIGFKK